MKRLIFLTLLCTVPAFAQQGHHGGGRWGGNCGSPPVQQNGTSSAGWYNGRWYDSNPNLSSAGYYNGTYYDSNPYLNGNCQPNYNYNSGYDCHSGYRNCGPDPGLVIGVTVLQGLLNSGFFNW